MLQLPRFASGALEETQTQIEDSLISYSSMDHWGLGQAALLVEEFGGIDFNALADAYLAQPAAVNPVLSTSFQAAVGGINALIEHDAEQSEAWCGFRIDRIEEDDQEREGPNFAFVFEISKGTSGYEVDGLLSLDNATRAVVLSAMELVASVGYAPYTPEDCAAYTGGWEGEAFEELKSRLPSHLKTADAKTLQAEYGEELEEFEFYEEIGLGISDEPMETQIANVFSRFVAWRDVPSAFLQNFNVSDVLYKAPQFHIQRVRTLAKSLNHQQAADFVASALDSLERLLDIAGGDLGWKRYRKRAQSLFAPAWGDERYSPIGGGFLLTVDEKGDYWHDVSNGYHCYVMETGEIPSVRINTMCSESRRFAKINYARLAVSEQIYLSLSDFSKAIKQEMADQKCAQAEPELLAA